MEVDRSRRCRLDGECAHDRTRSDLLNRSVVVDQWRGFCLMCSAVTQSPKCIQLEQNNGRRSTRIRVGHSGTRVKYDGTTWNTMEHSGPRWNTVEHSGTQ